jgi:hypothetical protein
LPKWCAERLLGLSNYIHSSSNEGPEKTQAKPVGGLLYPETSSVQQELNSQQFLMFVVLVKQKKIKHFY